MEKVLKHHCDSYSLMNCWLLSRQNRRGFSCLICCCYLLSHQRRSFQLLWQSTKLSLNPVKKKSDERKLVSNSILHPFSHFKGRWSYLKWNEIESFWIWIMFYKQLFWRASVDFRNYFTFFCCCKSSLFFAFCDKLKELKWNFYLIFSLKICFWL